MSERRVISVIVLNEHGVLTRITGLFAARGYNIETLTVAPIPNSKYSRLTIVTSGSPRVIEQIIKQLHKLIPVYKVIEHSELVEKEMVMAKIPLEERLSDVEALCRAYNGNIVNIGQDSAIIMAADEPSRIANFISALKRFNPKEIVRSGVVAIER
ncbi:acetolactate synthase small subunit [Nitratiruptor tergarcus]|uniref:Acetolactate synthase small subunit n=1 Tax=Nitratiruptor tergarcus DSM 16512 TaxID=1069081 RepID=A0A1W1WTD7_9BACT|nr:acetolactate synthase small subunit [Nitratiruptor tergarcus]SMC09588.1 acetolactate synthase, small subunit [Nitratiruptor tergarcus DSM 16512]